MSTWVLLRGLMREQRHWGEFATAFRSAMSGDEMVMLDFPGNGSLHLQTSVTSVKEMVSHCRSQLLQLGYKPPYSVFALSLGAMVAVEWSTQYPQEIERMVLVNTSLAPHNPFYERLRPFNYVALLFRLLFGTTVQREQLILRLTSNRDFSTQQRAELLARWVSYAREFPTERGNILRQLCAAATYRAALTKPKVAILLLAGGRDRLVNSRCSRTIAERWLCPIKLHPTAGHDLPLDEGTWVVQQVQEWLLTR